MALADPGHRAYDRDPFLEKFSPWGKSLYGDAFQRVPWNDAPNHGESVRVGRDDFPLACSSSSFSEDLLGMNPFLTPTLSPRRLCRNRGDGEECHAELVSASNGINKL